MDTEQTITAMENTVKSEQFVSNLVKLIQKINADENNMSNLMTQHQICINRIKEITQTLRGIPNLIEEYNELRSQLDAINVEFAKIPKEYNDY